MLNLQLETIAVCDAACVFCPYPKMERAKGTMGMDLFRQIIDQAVTVPMIDHITLTGLGEPLLDRFLFERIAYVRKVLPGINLDLVTNGSFLTAKRIDDFIALGLTCLSVSLNASNAAKRKAIMGVDNFDHVVEMCEYAIAMGAGKMRVLVKGVASKDLMEGAEHADFLKAWGGQCDQPGGKAFLHLEGNWAGSVWKTRMPMVTPCSRALTQIMVLWDGRVSLCCFDAEGAEILGDLNTQPLRDVFNGPRASFIRDAHLAGRRSEIPLCAGCTSI